MEAWQAQKRGGGVFHVEIDALEIEECMKYSQALLLHMGRIPETITDISDADLELYERWYREFEKRNPEQVAAVLKTHPEIRRARLIVSLQEGGDVMTLKCEADGPLNTDAIAETIRIECKLRGGVEPVPPGALPNDGKVIEDTRGAT